MSDTIKLQKIDKEFKKGGWFYPEDANEMVQEINKLIDKVDYDTEMSDTSEKAVQNKVIKGYVDDGLDTLQEQVNANTSKINSIVDVIYPVGSIYISANDVDPSKLFGGTWEPIYNRFLLTSGSEYPLGSYGGEATHALTVEETPTHQHAIYVDGNTANDGYRLFLGNDTWYNETVGTAAFRVNGDMAAQYKGFEAKTNVVGGGKAHNNLPPYWVVNAWIRRA